MLKKIKFSISVILIFIVSISYCESNPLNISRYYLNNETPNLLMDNFKYERTDLGIKLWKLVGKKAWIFDKSNQVELSSGNLELYKSSKKNQLSKTDIEFNNCLFNKSNNAIKLNNNIKMTFYSDTYLILKTSELFFNGESKVENNVKNIFYYGNYILSDKGLIYNTISSILNLNSEIYLKDESGNYLKADNGQIDLNLQIVTLNNIKKGEFDGYTFSADKCELKSNILTLSGNIKASDKTNNLLTEKIVYDMKKKTIYIESEFNLFSDTFSYNGKNLFLNNVSKSMASNYPGIIKIKKDSKIIFDKINYMNEMLVLKENVKAENDTFVLSCEILNIIIDKTKQIKKIYSEKNSEIIYKQGGNIKVGSMIVNFSNNEQIDSAFLYKNVNICSGIYSIVSDSAILKFSKNNPVKTEFTGNVLLTDKIAKLKTSELFVDLKNNYFEKIYSGYGNILKNNFIQQKNIITTTDTESKSLKKDLKISIENDSYLIITENFIIDFLENKAISGKSEYGVELFDKIMKSRLKSNNLTFNYINNKLDNLNISGNISGKIFIESKK